MLSVFQIEFELKTKMFNLLPNRLFPHPSPARKHHAGKRDQGRCCDETLLLLVSQKKTWRGSVITDENRPDSG